MQHATLRQALLDYAMGPHMRLLEDRYNALTLSVLNEAFPHPLYAVTTQDPLNGVRVLKDRDYGIDSPGSLTLISGPSPHRRSLSGSYYESDSGHPFDFPAGDRRRISLESIDSRGEALASMQLKKPDFTVLSFDGRRVQPRVIVELKKPGVMAEELVMVQVLEQIKAVVALTGIVPGAFLVKGTTWTKVTAPNIVDNNTTSSRLTLSVASFDSLDPNVAAILRGSFPNLPR